MKTVTPFMRKTLPALCTLSKEKMDVVSSEEDCVLVVRRWKGNNEVLAVFNFNDREVRLIQSIPQGTWRKRLDSEDARWMGRGSRIPDRMESAPQSILALEPHSVVLFEKEVQD